MLASMAEREQTRMLSRAKIVQIERNAKGKLVFLCISEMQPIFERSSEIQQFPEIRRLTARNLPNPSDFIRLCQ